MIYSDSRPQNGAKLIVNIQSILCSVCNKKTPHIEELDETFLSRWRCLCCNNTQRPGGNSMVSAGRPVIDDPGCSTDPG